MVCFPVIAQPRHEGGFVNEHASANLNDRGVKPIRPAVEQQPA
jgi:hypothetical protein